MLNLHLNLIFVSFSLYFVIRQTSATIFEETPLEELDRLIKKQLADESADNSEFQFSRYRRTLEQPVKFRLCGQALILKLTEVCNGCTGPIPKNKIDSDIEIDFRKKRDVHEHHHDHSRRTKRVGLADQCCFRKECTMDIIKKHCAPC